MVVIIGASDYGQVDQGFVLIDAANVAISALAIIIGRIGAMNTMIMSVFERNREIGVLRAIGWSGRRVLGMVLIESLLLCVLAAGLGSLLGVAISQLVVLFPAVQGFIELAYTPRIFVQAILVAVAVGIAGARYPAIRAARLTPMRRSAMSDPTMIHLGGIVKTFDQGRLRALDDVDLDIAAAALIAIVGPSGCGKSTLLDLIVALDLPDSGVIVMADRGPSGGSGPWSCSRS